MNKKILVIGAGPILVGQACEFDYSGCQSCKTLKEEKFFVVLLNSNPATIMTDYEIADSIYIESINKNNLIKIIQIEKPDFILPTMGGQTALNCIFEFINSNFYYSENKILGINKKILINAESRFVFYKLINNLNLKCPDSIIIRSIEDIKNIKNINFPCIIRPSFTLGGLGSGIAYNYNNLNFLLKNAFLFSNEISLDKSIIGWKEYELELLIDNYNNIIVICCIENIDPVGIHTGDSITITPAQTISDKEYQNMRDASFIILKSIGLKGGGANIQFAINPINGDLVIIEMNPRISRSSALASKATGFPIAKISTKLSIGYNLIKLYNDITCNNSPAGYEPCIDYIVIKFPKFNFEKYFELNFLNTVMKSIGEVLGIGFSFKEAFIKAIYSIIEEEKIPSFLKNKKYSFKNNLIKKVLNSNSKRIFYIIDLFRLNFNIKFIFCLSKIDPWYLYYIKDIVFFEKKTFDKIKKKKIKFKKIDSCSNEFESPTSYYYSSISNINELRFSIKKNFLIIGSGSNRIGQSIEFDYCCTKFSKIIKKIGLNSIIINCNPETISTDYDTCNYLFFEPIINTYIKNIINFLNPTLILCQLGGQSPIKFILKEQTINKNFYGFNKNNILFGIKKKFNKLLKLLNFNNIKNYNCKNINDIIYYYNILKKTIITRLPNIIGGSLMKIIKNYKQILNFINKLENNFFLYIEYFFNNSTELDIDIIVENGKIIILNIIEHIDNTGIHSGDSNMFFPDYSLCNMIKKKIYYFICVFCYKLKLNGIINFQLCVKKKIFIIECNPRASRTIPFISKSSKYPIIYLYTLILLGYNICFNKKNSNFYFIKISIFPNNKFKIPKLSPEMKSTGEEMTYGLSIQECYYKIYTLNYKKIFFNTLKVYLFTKYFKKNNFKINTNSFFKKIFFDLNINSYVSNKKKNKYLISDKFNLLINKFSYTNNKNIILFLSSFDKKFLKLQKLNKV